jgi:hypothetical protein
VIVPGSGTDGLSGITGHGRLDGETHQITFEYEISAAPPADGAAGPRPAAG